MAPTAAAQTEAMLAAVRSAPVRAVRSPEPVAADAGVWKEF
jgi:hypothetical protein